MRYISHFSWRYSWDVSTLTRNDSEFHVCLSICLFAYFLTKIRQRDISGSGWDIFLEFFGGIPDMLVHWFQIILIFCMSVSLVVGILPYWNPTNLGISPALDEISFWIFMDTFLGCFYTSSRYFLKPNYACVRTRWIFMDTFLGCWYTSSKSLFLYVCQLVIWLLP